MDWRAFGVAFILTLAGVAAGLWQVAALAGFVGAYLARERPYRSAVSGAATAWLLVLLIQIAGTSGGRVAGALGSALLGAAGLPVLALASLLFGLLLAALGAAAGRSLKRLVAKERP